MAKIGLNFHHGWGKVWNLKLWNFWGCSSAMIGEMFEI